MALSKTAPSLKAGERENKSKRNLVSAQKVIAKANKIFGDKAGEWLKTPNRALGGKKPQALLFSAKGAEQVMTILGRIEYGVFS